MKKYCKKCNGELNCKQVKDWGYHVDCMPEMGIEDIQTYLAPYESYNE